MVQRVYKTTQSKTRSFNRKKKKKNFALYLSLFFYVLIFPLEYKIKKVAQQVVAIWTRYITPSKGFQNTLNPTDYWNPNSRLESSTWNPEFVVWNPESKTGLDSLTSGKNVAKYRLFRFLQRTVYSSLWIYLILITCH